MRETVCTEESGQAARKQRLKRVLTVGSAVLVLLCIGIWWMIGEMFGYTTSSRMESLCAEAHAFANMAEAWKKQSGHPMQTGIYKFSDADDALTGFAVTHLGSHRADDWFGIVLDADGEIVYTMCSDSRIPDDCLTAPPDRETQMELLDSHFSFRRRQAIGVWLADDSD